MCETYWLDCPTCGAPRRPTKKVKHIHATYFRNRNPQGVYEVMTPARYIQVSDVEMVQVSYVKRTGKMGRKFVPEGRCEACGTLCRGRAVEMHGGGLEGKTKCGAACLSGQRSCDCHCGGRCHGAGKCHCA